MKRFSILILIFCVLITSIIFWIDLTFFFQILLISILIRFTVEFFLLGIQNYKLCSTFVDITQLLYTCLAIIFTYYSTTNNGEIIPNLLIGDTLTYYNESIYFTSIAETNFLNYIFYTNINYFFYQFLLSIIFLIFGGNFYFTGLMFSAFSGILNLLLIIKISELIKLNSLALKYVIIFYIIFPHIIASSTTLLKDNIIVYSFLLLIYNILKVVLTKPKLKYYIILFFALVLCALLRLPFVLIFLFIIAYTYINFSVLKTKNLIYFVIFLFTFISLDIASISTNIYENQSIFQAFQSQQSRIYESGVTGSGLTNFLVGDYANNSFVLKVLKLPIVVIVQYLNPINIFYFDHISPWQYVDINLKFIWLLFLGPLLIFCMLNYRSFNSISKYIFSISLFGYILIAFLNGGIVPRYALCFMVISVIPMGYCYSLIVTNTKYRVSFMRFSSLYIIIALLASSIYLFI